MCSVKIFLFSLVPPKYVTTRLYFGRSGGREGEKIKSEGEAKERQREREGMRWEIRFPESRVSFSAIKSGSAPPSCSFLGGGLLVLLSTLTSSLYPPLGFHFLPPADNAGVDLWSLQPSGTRDHVYTGSPNYSQSILRGIITQSKTLKK